ncbi:unnamed protein product [Allacma fusca]|uniref:CCHC-type domain-containing protein n=1 Tax=Allacma fusca TaxID=39272 RepID=A0A8J2JM81_9HEXA|nr:unnamed protein product [Allacma fusca]
MVTNDVKSETKKETHGSKRSCIYCKKEDHFIGSCSEFKSLSTDARWEFVKSKRTCFCCLQPGHNLKTCRKVKNCGIADCQRPHNQLLHKFEEKEAAVQNVMLSHIPENPRIMLKVLPVTLYGPKGEIETYALFDDCSSATLLDEKIASLLGLKGDVDPLIIRGTSSLTHADEKSRRVEVSISGPKSGKFNLKQMKARGLEIKPIFHQIVGGCGVLLCLVCPSQAGLLKNSLVTVRALIWN